MNCRVYCGSILRYGIFPKIIDVVDSFWMSIPFTNAAKELRELQADALNKRLNELKLELSVEKRKIASTGVSSKVVKTRAIKRDIARINTILNERGASL